MVLRRSGRARARSSLRFARREVLPTMRTGTRTGVASPSALRSQKAEAAAAAALVVKVRKSELIDSHSHGAELALFIAAQKGHTSVAEMLIANKANVDAVTSPCGRTALHLAARALLHPVDGENFQTPEQGVLPPPWHPPAMKFVIFPQ